MSVAVMRAILAVPGHGFNAVAMGYYLSLARFHEGQQKNKYLLKSLLVPAIMHGLYDFTLMYLSKSAQNPFLVLLLIISFTIIVILTWKKGLSKIALHYRIDAEAIKQQESAAMSSLN